MPESKDGLTAREWEVARLVAGGLTNPEIATELIVTRATVESHIHSMLQKLALRNRTELARWVIDAPPKSEDQ